MKRITITTFLLAFVIIQAKAQIITYSDMAQADSVDSWLDQRVENAKNGQHEKVEMPFVVRCTGWGCACPDYYIGVAPSVQDGPFISAKAPEGFPDVDSKGYSLIVTGYFTGKIVKVDLRGKYGPEEELYHIPQFKVLSWKENTLDYDVPAPHVIIE
jgi:hypothetical protein